MYEHVHAARMIVRSDICLQPLTSYAHTTCECRRQHVVTYGAGRSVVEARGNGQKGKRYPFAGSPQKRSDLLQGGRPLETAQI